MKYLSVHLFLTFLRKAIHERNRSNALKLKIVCECLTSDYVTIHLARDHINRNDALGRNLLIPLVGDEGNIKVNFICDLSLRPSRKCTYFSKGTNVENILFYLIFLQCKACPGGVQ